MKQSDMFTVGVLAVSGFLVSLLLCNMLLGNPDDNEVQFSTIAPISNDVAEPNPEVFNSKAINPTVEVYVGKCKDWDRNGTIDDAEWAACNNVSGGTEDSTTTSDSTQGE